MHAPSQDAILYTLLYFKVHFFSNKVLVKNRTNQFGNGFRFLSQTLKM